MSLRRDRARIAQRVARWLPAAFRLAAIILIAAAPLLPVRAANEPLATPTPTGVRATPTPRPDPTRSRVRATPTPRPTPDRTGPCRGPFQSVSKPLTDLGKGRYVRMGGKATGFTGGLYPGGSNVRPPAHAADGLALARQILPLDVQGRADPNGKIGLVVVGMSNTHHEFRRFEQLVSKRSDVNPRLVLVNGAIAGRTAKSWTDPKGASWQELDRRVKWKKLTPEQVQVAWIKQTLTGGGEFPRKSQELEADLATIARNLKAKFPNLKIAYFSSRTRAYTYGEGLGPEPSAFETGFAVKWLVEKQINGDAALNFDPAHGPVVAPLITWGPYFWIDGENPRSDGRVWTALDLAWDCTHPSDSGLDKVADMLMTFFMTDPTAAGWFRAAPR